MRGMRGAKARVGAMTRVGAVAGEYDPCGIGDEIVCSPGAALLAPPDSSICPRLLTCRLSACGASARMVAFGMRGESGDSGVEHRPAEDSRSVARGGVGKKAMRRMAEAARMRSASEPRLV